MRRVAIVAALLTMTVTACVAQAPGGPPPPTGGGGSPPSLIGAWRSSLQVSSGALATIEGLEFMYVVHIDRTLIESSNYDAAPPVPPAYGVWRMVEGGGSVFEARYEFFTTTTAPRDQFLRGAGWLPSGHGVFSERITVAPDGKTFTSTIRYQLFDVDGKGIDGGGEATGRGVRIDF